LNLLLFLIIFILRFLSFFLDFLGLEVLPRAETRTATTLTHLDYALEI